MGKLHLIASLLFLVLTLSACGSIESHQGKIDNVMNQMEQTGKEIPHSIENDFEITTIKRQKDGDTVVATTGETIRFIGVNTPESTNKQETYGKEASNFTSEQLVGKQVYLQKDVSETDRYGRLLRYVWLEMPTDPFDENEIRSKMFNAILVLEGYAEPSTYPPDVTYSEFFVEFARKAHEQGKGLWQFGEEGTTKGDNF